MKRLVFLLAVITVALAAGCTTSSFGTRMSADKVNQIKKGVTTRAEVESLLGSPTTGSMLGDGRRMMVYVYSNAKAHATGLGSALIPYGFLFMGGARGEREQQTLQIVLNQEGIVQDYEFLSNSSLVESSGGILANRTVMTPVPNKE